MSVLLIIFAGVAYLFFSLFGSAFAAASDFIMLNYLVLALIILAICGVSFSAIAYQECDRKLAAILAATVVAIIYLIPIVCGITAIISSCLLLQKVVAIALILNFFWTLHFVLNDI